MNRTRWLAVLLLVSWTINIALGVALYYRSRMPFPPLIGIRPRDPAAPPPFAFLPDDERQAAREAMTPLFQEQRRLSLELIEALSEDALDTALVMRCSDSLGKVRWKMQDMMVRRASALHGRLEPDQRRDLCCRMIGKFDHERRERGICENRRRFSRPPR